MPNSENVWEKDVRLHGISKLDNHPWGQTVEDDAAFGPENQGIPLEEMEVRVTEALSLVGMAEFSKRNQLLIGRPEDAEGCHCRRVVALRPDI